MTNTMSMFPFLSPTGLVGVIESDILMNERREEIASNRPINPRICVLETATAKSATDRSKDQDEHVENEERLTMPAK